MNAIRNVCKRVGQSKTHPGPSGHPSKEGSFFIPSLEGSCEAGGWVSPTRFFRDRHAVGTAITAAIFTLMSLAGVALVGDHKHMTTNRDLLKAAANAATIAVVMELDGRSLSALTAEERSAVDATAQRYILANIKANVSQDTYQQAASTLSVTLKDTGPGLVDVDASADMGNIVFGRWLWSDVAKTTEVVSRTERVSTTTEVVLALDTTNSMYYSPNGIWPGNAGFSESRLPIVKKAALSLVDSLTADDNDQTAVGLVPWSYKVRLDQETRTRWLDHAWAAYPQKRYYPRPYLSVPPDTVAPGETQAPLPVTGEEWLGCVDQRPLCSYKLDDFMAWDGCLGRYTNGSLPPGLSLDLPRDQPLTMRFFSARTYQNWLNTRTTSYRCRAGGVQKYCYDDSDVPDDVSQADRSYDILPAQENCGAYPTIMPLTAQIDTVKERIENLSYAGSQTYSTLGLVWGRRLLASSWNQVWGGGAHPAPPDSNVQKALVLLTDGEDNLVRGTSPVVREHRERACTAAKDEGITVFTIAAMDTEAFPNLKTDLISCASKPEYAFINNSTPDALEKAFQDIAAQLLRFRRVM